eukprot:3490200-Rhodomonas_salina.1
MAGPGRGIEGASTRGGGRSSAARGRRSRCGGRSVCTPALSLPTPCALHYCGWYQLLHTLCTALLRLVCAHTQCALHWVSPDGLRVPRTRGGGG